MPFQESEAGQPTEPWRVCSGGSVLWTTCVGGPSFVRQVPSLSVESPRASDVASPPQPSLSLAHPLLAAAVGAGDSAMARTSHREQGGRCRDVPSMGA
eukprot:15456315-Alexandrium_andersonii.AAC.1